MPRAHALTSAAQPGSGNADGHWTERAETLLRLACTSTTTCYVDAPYFGVEVHPQRRQDVAPSRDGECSAAQQRVLRQHASMRAA